MKQKGIFCQNEVDKKEEPHFNLLESLKKDLKEAKGHLSKLYDLDDGYPDEVLKSKIAAVRRKIADINRLLEDEQNQVAIEDKIENTKEILRNLESTWPILSPKERQMVCRDLIERVEIDKNGSVKVILRLKNYLQNIAY